MNPQVEQLRDAFNRQVVRRLGRLGSTIKRRILIEGAALCVGALVVLVTLQFFLDRLLLLGLGPRVAATIGILGLMAYQVYRHVVSSLTLRIGAPDVAALIERREPALGDRLLTAVVFSTESTSNPQRNSPALIASLMRDSLAAFQTIPTAGLLRGDRYWQRVSMALAAAGLITAFAALSPATASVYLQRNWLLRDVAWPASSEIAAVGFTDGKMRWPIGDDLKIVARATEGAPTQLYAEIEYPSGERVERSMDRLGVDQFILDYGPLHQAMRLRFLIARFGVDEQTGWYEVQAVERPGVRSVAIEVAPPAYTGQPPFRFSPGQASADILRGSRVRIEAEMNKPVASAVLRSRSDPDFSGAASIVDDVHLGADFTPDRGGTYFFDVLDRDGLDDRAPVSYVLNLITDPPPKVRLGMNGVGEMVTPAAQLKLVVEAEDNLGLQTIELLHQTRPAKSQNDTRVVRQPLPAFTPGQQKYNVNYAWPLVPLTLLPGDQITLEVQATDHQPVTGPDESAAESQVVPPNGGGDAASTVAAPANQGRSVAYSLRVVTPEELLAELGRRENEWRREFEQIIKAQEQMNKRVMLLRDLSGAEAMSNERAIRSAQEARTQRQQLSRVRTVLRQFQQIMDELEVNELATPQVRRRLQNRVLAPLRSLVATDISAVADLLDRLRDDYSNENAEAAEAAQKSLLRTMYAILADMLKWEGYNEAVAIVRDVVRLQQEVNEDTQAELEREIERLFGGSAEPSTQPAGDKP